MKLLDSYILKSFIRNLSFALLSFIVIFILVDLFENLDKFIDKGLKLTIISQYYIYFIPEILKLILPLSILLASLFTTSKFVNFAEMIAYNSSGLSIYRFMSPIFIFGIFLTILTLYFNGWVVPNANAAKFRFEREVLGKGGFIGSQSNLYFQESENRIIRIENFDLVNSSCSNVSIQKFKKNSMIFRFDIKSMIWDSSKSDWKLALTTSRIFDSSAAKEKMLIDSGKFLHDYQELKTIALSPSLIKKKETKPDELNLTDLKEFIENEERTGQNVVKTQVDYYSRISYPFAGLVTIIFGVSLSSNRRKGGAALQFGISILVCFIYLGFLKISQTFGYNGDIPPLLTAWLANIVFSLVAFYYLFKINK
ncbi:MAG: LptF/LptG family permease [Ignavibacteria bacterium]|nr:LptF/LptG family permease [Ignavibacteria bacterium]